MITERIETDKIEIVGPYKQIQIRTASVLERDGAEMGRTYSRVVVGPLDEAPDAEIQALKDLYHTQEVIDAYTSTMATVSMGSTSP